MRSFEISNFAKKSAFAISDSVHITAKQLLETLQYFEATAARHKAS